MSEKFDPVTWLKEKGKDFNGDYAEIKKIDPTLDAAKIKAIGSAVRDVKAKEINSKALDSVEAIALLNLSYPDF